MKTFKIKDKIIGGDNPCFIIAEIGLNHNGSMEIAKKLIDKACEAGADCVKFQKRDVANLAIKEVLDAQDLRFPEFGKNYREIREHLEFSEIQYKEIKQYCQEKNILFLCTPFDINSADFLEKLGVEAYKIASHSLTNLPLIEHIAKKGKPMLVSTGMATLEEIDETVNLIKKYNTPLLLFHCVSVYPHSLEESNLRVIDVLRKRYDDIPIGYSGHEVGIVPSLVAASLGVKAIERHFTLSKNMVGFDHKLSLEPEELKELILRVRRKNFRLKEEEIKKALGAGIKEISEKEWITRRKYHSSIVAARDIPKGTVVTTEDFTLKNPGVGLESRYFPRLIGKRTKVDIKKDTLINLGMFQIEHLLVDKNSSIKEAMRIIDRMGLGIAFVVDDNKKLLGVITDGDIRRAILKGIDIERPVEKIAIKNPIVIEDRVDGKKDLEKWVKEEAKRRKISLVAGSFKVPVLDKKGVIRDIVFVDFNIKDRFFSSESRPEPKERGIKKILLIGGAGYFGSVLCQKLLNRGYRVRVLDNLTYGDWGIKSLYQNKNFEFQKGDIRNISDIIEAIKDVDAVIHLAAIVGDAACAAQPQKTLETNYLATKMVIDVCKYFQVNRFIFSSTCSVYGKSSSPEQKLTEASPLNPVSLYAETKIKCEKGILKAMGENFSPTILRMATLYGFSPNMRFDLAINLMTVKALFDKKITIFGGEQWRPWLHLEDAASAYITCLEEPIDKVRGEIFNLVSENYKVIEIAKIISSLCPEARLELKRETKDRRNYNVSFDKISQKLDYQPRKKITDGVLEIKNLAERGLIKKYKDQKYRLS